MKTHSLILVAACCMTLAACSARKDGNTPVATDNKCNSRICNYLYGLEYDDYDFEGGVAFFDRHCPTGIPACSEARKGRFVGRNLDWYINCDASAAIKVNAAPGRYASIGMVGCNTRFTEEFAASGEYDDVYRILPLNTTDGVNEKGLYIGVNVMPTGETSFDESSWKYGQWGLGAAFTNPEADLRYCVMYLVRVVLDRAASVDEAKTLIRSINWYEPVGFPAEGCTQAFHWLICDAHKSCVLEFIDNVPCFTENEVTDRPSYATVMTNFTNKLMADKCLVQAHGMGYERFDVLVDSYEETEESLEGMQQLMQKVWYSKAYTTDNGSHKFMLTDFSTDQFPAYYLYKHYEYWEDAYLQEYVAHLRASFADKTKWHHPDTQLWYTTHSVVYDLERLEFAVLTHEGLDGQEDYYHVTFRSTFAKPLAQ